VVQVDDHVGVELAARRVTRHCSRSALQRNQAWLTRTAVYSMAMSSCTCSSMRRTISGRHSADQARSAESAFVKVVSEKKKK
jgi:hypothetical protein